MNANKLDAKWPQHLEGCEKLPVIPNIGLTCFANAQMQVFNHTPAFFNYFRNYTCKNAECLKKQDCEMKQSSKVLESLECYHCLIKEYIEHVEFCQRYDTKIASGKFLKAVMRDTEQMQVGRSCDAEEFLMHLEEKLDMSNRTSILSDIYYCDTATIYRCKTCGNKWQFRTTQHLLLNKGCITDKLAEMSEEKDIDYPRTCRKCTHRGNSTEKTVIDTPPHVLQIRLQTVNRFGIQSKTDFPETINIRPYMEDKTGPAVVYELYAVVVYTGGHYYADCKAPSGQWNNCDDGFVRQMSLNEVLKENPFCLYYKRSPYKGVYDKLGIEEALIREQLYYDNLREKIARDADAADKKIKEFEEEYDAHAHEYSYESYSDYSTNPSSTDDDSTEEDQT